MKAKSAVIGGVFVGGLAVIAYIMRGGRKARQAAPPVQFGLADGAVHTLGEADADAAELRELGSAVARALEAR